MGFVKFYKTRLSPIVTIVAIVFGIHLSWWSIQQKLVRKKKAMKLMYIDIF